MNRTKYPLITKVFTTVCLDNDKPESDIDAFEAPDEYLEMAEHGLSPLTDYELDTFAIGEQSEQEEIMMRSEELQIANTIIEFFFNGENFSADVDENSLCGCGHRKLSHRMDHPRYYCRICRCEDFQYKEK